VICLRVAAQPIRRCCEGDTHVTAPRREDPRNDDAFSELGILWVGPLLEQFTNDFVGGFSEGNDPKDVVNETEYGAVVGELRPAPHQFRGGLATMSNTEKDDWQEVQDYVGLVRPVVFLRDPLNRPRQISQTWYMRLMSPLQFTASEGINDQGDTGANAFPATWSTDIALREIMP
jgi:hypothetical protein